MNPGYSPLSPHMSKAPTPANKHPLLPSTGYDEMRVTRHNFVKAVETSLPGPDPGEWEDVWQFIFACEETGAERVWGYASREPFDIPVAKDN